MNVGDNVYRYRFDFASRKKSVDVFKIFDVSSKGKDWR